MESPMSQPFDASRSLTAFEQDNTLVAVIEMSQSKWLVAAVIPRVERQPLKKLDAEADALLKLLQRWRDEARKAGPMRPGGTGSGWRAGCGRMPSRPTSSMLRASRCHASTAVPRAIGSIQSCSCARFLAGCVARSATAAWS